MSFLAKLHEAEVDLEHVSIKVNLAGIPKCFWMGESLDIDLPWGDE